MHPLLKPDILLMKNRTPLERRPMQQLTRRTMAVFCIERSFSCEGVLDFAAVAGGVVEGFEIFGVVLVGGAGFPFVEFAFLGVGFVVVIRGAMVGGATVGGGVAGGGHTGIEA